MRLFTLIAMTLVLLVSGCVSAPPLPRIAASRGDRIGVLVEAGDNLTHTHIGTTMMNNFEKEYRYDFHLHQDITRIIEQTVGNAGFVDVDLRAEGFSYKDLVGLVQAKDGQWRITPGKEALARRLHQQLGLKALIVLKEDTVLVDLECAGGPCAERYAKHAGLYSRSLLVFTQYRAVAAYRWNVYVLDPVADVALSDPIRSKLRIPAVPLAGFKDPADFNNVTEAEFGPVREAILRFTQNIAGSAVETLNVAEH